MKREKSTANIARSVSTDDILENRGSNKRNMYSNYKTSREQQQSQHVLEMTINLVRVPKDDLSKKHKLAKSIV
jgi:hypothetical protein